MNNFIRRAFDKIEKLSTDEIKTLVRYQASENELLGAVLQTINTGIVVINANARVLTCNDAAKRMIPLRRNLVEGASLKFILKDTDVAQFMLDSITLSDRQKKREQDFYFQRGDEVMTLSIQSVVYQSSFEPLMTYDTGSRILFIINDVSEERSKEARLQRSESLASLTTVAAGVAHEIKNPLASIGIHLQLLRKAFERKTQLTLEDSRRYLDVIDEEIERLNSIVVDFLFAVRPMNVCLRYEQLNSIVEDVCSFVNYELGEHQISLKLDLEDYLPKLRIDENLIKQVLLNIIKNAIHAMDDLGGVLTVKTRNRGDTIALMITDTGCGMDDATRSKIFEPYFTTKESGSGLGLTMVFKVIKEHGGEINVTSSVGKGTTFTIVLPVPTSQRLAIEAKEE
ncbi:MAG: ATP-binding protein [Sphaerochaetaceae bacterium]|nr:ATP-binding protein [Sphaerochaetaceae bacterium]MDC7248209.1 ATP-binding protein [Sphaerochaetaceae bacterium]